MPLMDGYRFSAKVLKLYKSKERPFIVALTGHTEMEFFLHAFKKGID